ncbi:MAG: AraC family transcriptional regulator [Victivallaceae bacterium]|nr:AraC family transcriptional regulator [Victivallaceae bacterium]
MPKIDVFTEQKVHMVPDSLLMLQKAQQMDRVPVHIHDFIEIAFVASGSALHCHSDGSGRTRMGCLIQGDVFSIQRGEQHGYEQCGSMVLYNIFIRPEFLKTCEKLNILPGWKLFFGERTSVPETVLHLSAEKRENAVRSLDRAVVECRLRQPGYEMALNALVIDFLISVMRSAELTRPEFDEDKMTILKSISMMEKTPERHFSLDFLAKTSNMSASSYSKKFHAAIGIAPMEYLQKVRLLQVKNFLASSELPIDQIAGKCGFCTPNYLIKIFRREFGITPSQYRKKLLVKASK